MTGILLLRNLWYSEIVEEIKIRKRDGSLESWNYDKILISITKVDVPLEAAEKATTDIEGWAKENAKDGVISSTQIRDKVIKTLTELDPIAADHYIAYKK